MVPSVRHGTEVNQILAIDFDGVLHNPNDVEDGRRMGRPVEGAREAMTYLANQGDTLIVFTVRGGEQRSRKAVEDWLTFFNIPFSAVTNIKPKADAYVDNLGIRFTNWPQALRDIGSL